MSRPVRAPILSEFSDEPEMLELIEQFVAEMPARVKALRAAWTAREMNAVRRTAHQLKGAAGGYGFSIIGDTAAELEDRLQEEASQEECGAIDEVRELVESLLDLCERARAG